MRGRWPGAVVLAGALGGSFGPAPTDAAAPERKALGGIIARPEWPEEPASLLRNSSFEETDAEGGLTHWGERLGEHVSISDTVAHSGRRSLQIKDVHLASRAPAVSQALSLAPGWYSLRAWVKTVEVRESAEKEARQREKVQARAARKQQRSADATEGSAAPRKPKQQQRRKEESETRKKAEAQAEEEEGEAEDGLDSQAPAPDETPEDQDQKKNTRQVRLAEKRSAGVRVIVRGEGPEAPRSWCEGRATGGCSRSRPSR